MRNYYFLASKNAVIIRLVAFCKRLFMIILRGKFMIITLETFIILCPLVFLAGFIDSIAGGGGIIALPAFLLTGCPIHQAIATNKLSSSFGTGISALRFIKNRMINYKITLPGIFIAILGSMSGAELSLIVPDRILKYLMFIILPIAALIVLNKNTFKTTENTNLELTPKFYFNIFLSIFLCGIYDGFYGPGTGTLLIIAITTFGKMNVTNANANAKIINFTSNLGGLIIYIMNGQAIFLLGIVAAVFSALGNYLGSGLAIKKGASITRPLLIIVLAMLLIKILVDLG